MSVLRAHLYQCTSWHCCERLCLASVIFFWLSVSLPISWWVIYKRSCSHYAECSAGFLLLLFSSFWTKQNDPPTCPTLPIHLILLRVTLFGFLRWKTSKGNVLPCGKSETKNGKSTEGIKIDKFKNHFEQWKKSLNRCITSNGEYFEGAWSLNT